MTFAFAILFQSKLVGLRVDDNRLYVGDERAGGVILMPRSSNARTFAPSVTEVFFESDEALTSPLIRPSANSGILPVAWLDPAARVYAAVFAADLVRCAPRFRRRYDYEAVGDQAWSGLDYLSGQGEADYVRLIRVGQLPMAALVSDLTARPIMMASRPTPEPVVECEADDPGRLDLRSAASA